MKRKLLVLCLAVLALFMLGGCSKKETVREDFEEFLNTELEMWRIQDRTIRGIPASDISIEISSVIGDPLSKGCYIATIDFIIETDAELESDTHWLCSDLLRIYGYSAEKRFTEEYGHFVSINSADSLKSFPYEHYNVTLNGTLIRDNQENSDWSREAFVAENGDGGGDSGAHCRRCGAGYRYGTSGYNHIKRDGYCGHCREDSND